MGNPTLFVKSLVSLKLLDVVNRSSYILFKMKSLVMLIFCLLVQLTLQTVMAADKEFLSTDSSLLAVDDEAFVADDVADIEDNDDEDFGDDEVDEVADKHVHEKMDSIILSSLTEAMNTIDEISESTYGRQVRSAGNLFRTKSRRRSP